MDILKEQGALFLGSRLKRLAERMQADVLQSVEAAGLQVQPSQYPMLVALDRLGPMTVGGMVEATGVSQPAVTRTLGHLVELGLVSLARGQGDQRHKTISLTPQGQHAVARSKAEIWPYVTAAVQDMCAGLNGALLDQIDALESALASEPLSARMARARAAGLSIRGFSDDLAGAFHDINAQWIGAMFALEETDRDVLENPRARIIAPGGDILFVHAEGLGIVGTCALQKTGERQFELTKMGVLESARGRKAGEFLLRAILRRAAELQADNLYLLTNHACAPAIHLYEKLGFAHDADIMQRFGVRYRRCTVAMRYNRPQPVAARHTQTSAASR